MTAGERSGKVFSLWTKAARVQQQHKQPKSLRTSVPWCSSEPKKSAPWQTTQLESRWKERRKKIWRLAKNSRWDQLQIALNHLHQLYLGFPLKFFFHVYLISHWVCGTIWSSVPNWGCFSLASNMGTDGVFSGQNIHRVSQASSLAARWI